MTSNASHKHLFYSEMAKLLGAGFDIRKAAAVLMDTKLPPTQAALLKNLNDGLEAGESITSSFSQDTSAITELERNIIGAGERGGKLAPAFQHLADYFGMIASAHREAVRSMIYPVIVLHMGIIIAMVPNALIKGEQSIAAIAGSFLTTLLCVYAGIFIILGTARTALRMAPENPTLDRRINRLPWLGAARRNLAMARFCKVYHSCLLAGISMNETAQWASHASQSGVIRAAGKNLIKAVTAGEPLGPHLMADATFPQAFARSYATGELAGTLDTDLGHWSKKFQNDAESSLRTASAMIPKLLYFFILGFVAWKILGFFNGYYTDLLQQFEDPTD